MAEGDEKEVGFKLSLETKEALEKLLQFRNQVDNLGKSEGPTELLEGLMKIGAMAGVVGAAYFSIKATIETVFDAEKIKAVNEQFEFLSKNAGVAAETLRKGLVEAAGGLIDDNELIKMANRSLLEMGSSAEKLPQLMELARKVGAVTGKDLSTAFDGLSQAIAMGNQRMLKHMGIIIDTQKAEEKYAAQIGVAVAALSQQEKRQAVLNEVLARGGESLKGVNVDATEAINTWKQTVVALTEVKDAIILTFEKVAGPTVRRYLAGVKEIAQDFKKYVTATLGEGAEASKAKLELLESKVRDIKGQLIDIEQKKLKGAIDFEPGMTTAKVKALTDQLAKYEIELVAAKKKVQDLHAETGEGSGGEGRARKKGPETDQRARLQLQAKFEQDMLKLREQRLQAEMAIETDLTRYHQEQAEQIQIIEEQLSAEIKKIRASRELNDIQKDQEEVQARATSTAKIKALEEKQRDEELKIFENRAHAHNRMIQGFLDGWVLYGMRAKKELMDSAAWGEAAAGALSSNLASAFEKVGEGSEDMGDALRDAMLSAIADIAIAKGALFISAGIGEMNPVEVAAGGALVALGGVLKGVIKGLHKTSISTPAVGSVSSFQGPDTTKDDQKIREMEKQQSRKKEEAVGNVDYTASQKTRDFGAENRAAEDRQVQAASQQQAPSKQVTIQIQGHYFDTDRTRQKLVDMIRESSDATGFTVQSTSGGF